MGNLPRWGLHPHFGRCCFNGGFREGFLPAWPRNWLESGTFRSGPLSDGSIYLIMPGRNLLFGQAKKAATPIQFRMWCLWITQRSHGLNINHLETEISFESCSHQDLSRLFPHLQCPFFSEKKMDRKSSTWNRLYTTHGRLCEGSEIVHIMEGSEI